MSSQDDQVDQRSKLLDAREKWIAEKEKLLDDRVRTNHLEQLDRQIEIKESMLKSLEFEYDELKKSKKQL